jgi:hypothetical protein
MPSFASRGWEPGWAPIIPRPRSKDKDLRVVGAVAVMVLAVVVMVFALVVMLAMVMAGWVIGAVLGDGGSGTANGERQGNGESSGYARYRFHFCLLMDEFRP